jgi:hypothetical protein
MDAARQAQVAFYLTGRRLGAELEPVEGLGLKPALLAHYRDLGALRYDYPLVLVDGDDVAAGIRPLSGLVDEALAGIAADEDGERVSKQVLRLEQALRQGATGAGVPLGELWTDAAERLGASENESLREALERARAALAADGPVVDCDAALPDRLFTHLWRLAQTRKLRGLRREIEGLIHRVSEILRADFARSKQGRSAASLQASLGGADADAFDFEALSGMLVRSANRSTLTETRRERLEALIGALRSCELDPEALRFTSCVEALRSWRERFPVLVKVARAISMAELEIAGDYREERHDAFYEDFGAEGLGSDDVARFADYFVSVNAATMDAQEQAALMEILSTGLPIKILVQTDDLLDEALPGAGRNGFGRSAVHFANMAMGLNEVFVLQAAASHLPRCVGPIADGIRYPGAALFSVFSGATGCAGDLPPYLVAAAAVESRAFPLFTFDPAAGTDWASRFSLDLNPQAERDWPVQTLSYENSERRRVMQEVAFTFVDFAALDERYARHLARMPAGQGEDATLPVAAAVATGTEDEPERVPCILMVNDKDQLERVLVDERLMREARRCRESWHSLQELAGIHNSHAERLLAAARAAATEESAAQVATSAEDETAAPAAENAPAAEAVAAEVPADEIAEGDPWIETPRCTTCNECTQINDQMFAYNENRQAFIADPDAGTYAQLVEAAESCQVSIIHPGRPRNPDEPGLEDLVQRAEPFQ